MSAEEDEANERRWAEIEFVRSAYGEDEAWVDEKEQTIYRRLLLVSAPDDIGIPVLLSLTMPDGYPIDEGAILVIDARVSDDAVGTSSSSYTAKHHLRKVVMDSLPSMIEACRSSALEYVGSESIFAVLSRADEWISTDFVDIVESSSHINTDEADEVGTKPQCDNGLVLGRRLIHSHHIIAQSKRKAIVELAQQHSIGGYFKIGWPGIIVIEGEERDCMAYVDEIRSMRWQHLVVRGEEQQEVSDREELEQLRVLPNKMHELGDDMSCVAERCKEAGLEELFLTSMKIYSKKESASIDASNQKENTKSSSYSYGALCHVDHMRDGKGYRKWLRKASAASGCVLLVKACDNNAKKPLIVVSILGEESDVKRVLKRWRTSRVDVDSAGKPCLERMMTVLIEGKLSQPQNKNVEMDSLDQEDQLVVSDQTICNILEAIGGSKWKNEFESLLHMR
mmetsp:Transcript_9516/g.13625  ORF Transcript_9516/g.13625 Transcript_9516/m.13625 type:complete len:452 (+) Transcript_9516:12-1367(+)